MKNNFLEVHAEIGNFDITHKQGIDLKKINEGCIIYNTKSEEAYVVKIFDSQNRRADT